MNQQDSLIEQYFHAGLQQQEILSFLKNIHSVDISQRTLKRTLSRLSLYRRKYFTNISAVVRFIQNEMVTSGQMHGYRWMHLRCLHNGLVVSQNVVRELINLLDPQGVEFRKRKRLRRRLYSNSGPNFLWHMDSYDKLKRYGICINGCIDGFSRHIIWLKAGCTSSDPKVIAGYYLDSVKSLGGCPATIRGDLGTENSIVKKIQTVLCEVYQTSIGRNKPSYISGRSTANQRIEAWWSILRKHNAQYWINLFESLRDDGLLSDSFLDRSLIQFCFLDIIQSDLDTVAYEWNTHKIRKSRNSIAPTGRPICLFQLPHLYSANDYIVNIPDGVVNVILDDQSIVRHNQSCDEDVSNLCNCIILENRYTKDTDPYNAVNLYIKLRLEIIQLLEQ